MAMFASRFVKKVICSASVFSVISSKNDSVCTTGWFLKYDVSSTREALGREDGVVVHMRFSSFSSCGGIPPAREYLWRAGCGVGHAKQQHNGDKPCYAQPHHSTPLAEG